MIRHTTRPHTPESILALVMKTATCWVWQGTVEKNGYGALKINGKTKKAHRIVYELLRGKIPDGLTLDHLCRVRACVNPDHLEPVTFLENVMRGEGIGAKHARQTACYRGHPYTPKDTYYYHGHEQCRVCRRMRHAALSPEARTRYLEYLSNYRRTHGRGSDSVQVLS